MEEDFFLQEVPFDPDKGDRYHNHRSGKGSRWGWQPLVQHGWSTWVKSKVKWKKPDQWEFWNVWPRQLVSIQHRKSDWKHRRMTEQDSILERWLWHCEGWIEQGRERRRGEQPATEDDHPCLSGKRERAVGWKRHWRRKARCTHLLGCHSEVPHTGGFNRSWTELWTPDVSRAVCPLKPVEEVLLCLFEHLMLCRRSLAPLGLQLHESNLCLVVMVFSLCLSLQSDCRLIRTPVMLD